MNYCELDHKEPFVLKEAATAYSLSPNYTVKDIEALPDGTRAELLDGQMFYMAPPILSHQLISKQIAFAIEEYTRSHNGSCVMLYAPFGVYLNKDNRNYLEPDIAVVCDHSKLYRKGILGAPDWIIEIVSPSSQLMDYQRKKVKYQSAGVREYWIVDEEKEQVTVYNFMTDAKQVYSFTDTIPVAIYEDFSIDFGKFEFSL